VDLYPWDWISEGMIFDKPQGNAIIQLLNGYGNVVDVVNFNLSFMVHVEPIGVLPTPSVPISLRIPFHQEASAIVIKVKGETVTKVNLTEKLLNDAIDMIPDHGFTHNPSQLRKALHNKVNALEKQISRQDFQAARNKLIFDIRKQLQGWLVEGYALTNPLQIAKNKILELVDELTTRLP
jgi:hypothetical protein